MSLEYFEPRPPQVVAVKLDFLDDSHGIDWIVSTLKEIPGVEEVSVDYFDERRKIVVNPRSDKGRLIADHWLVSIPPSYEMGCDSPKLRLMTDEEFNITYRRVESEVLA